MARHTSESLLISAILNTEDPQEYRRFGLRREHFNGYPEIFEWVDSYISEYNRPPAPQELTTRYDDFPYSAVQDRLEFPVSEVMEEYAKRTLSRQLAAAGEALRTGDVVGAYEAVGATLPALAHQEPVNLISDRSFLDDYGQKRDTIPLPWPTLQGITDGIDRGELWYFGARPAQGKSAVLLNIAAEAIMSGQSVSLYSLEMSEAQVRERLHAYLANRLGVNVTHTQLRRRQLDLLEYRALMDKIEEGVTGLLSVYTPRNGTVTPSVVSARAEDYDLSLIDYVGLMRTNSGKMAIEDWRVMAEISNELKAVTLARNARILAAVQINRQGDGDYRRRAPKLAQLAQSDAIGQDGDVVVTMNRYSETTLTLTAVKNRNAESDRTWYTHFLPDTGRFDEITRYEADDIADNEEN